MTTQNNNSNLISSVYTSRSIILELMESQGYDVSDYSKFSVNEVKSMKQNNQLDMLLEKKEEDPDTKIKSKIYIHYFIAKSLRPNDIDNIVDDLFILEEILKKTDTLFIVVKDNPNKTLTDKLVHLWETEGVFVVLLSIKRLQFNILKHVLVPEHKVISQTEVETVMKRYNISSKADFPEISRFDPVAQVIGLKPGNIVCIMRPSKTAILSPYYRVCV